MKHNFISQIKCRAVEETHAGKQSWSTLLKIKYSHSEILVASITSIQAPSFIQMYYL